MSVYQDLQKRGLIHQETSEKTEQLLGQPRTFYCGFDPSSDSLHIGSLMPLLFMRRLQKAGHKPIVLLGGATGMIGDPSGKSAERVLINKETIEQNIYGIRQVIEKFIDLKGPQAAMIVNNHTWMARFSFIEFLRDVGKHFSVNYMLSKDSVKSRIEYREQGISFTEFSYMLMQAYDFYVLNKNYNCQLQVGGSDQWGNITAGIELIRRMRAAQGNPLVDEVFGMTMPLVTKSDGTKFGKTEKGNIWLDARKTSAYQFYQFFLRLPDEDVETMVKYFSLASQEKIDEVIQDAKEAPQKRAMQNFIAEELTCMVHGDTELQKVKKATAALFAGDLKSLEKPMLLEAFSEVPSVRLAKTSLGQLTVIDALVESELCSSKGQARKDIQGGGIYVNNNRVEDVNAHVELNDLLYQSVLVLRKGKKNYSLVLFA